MSTRKRMPIVEETSNASLKQMIASLLPEAGKLQNLEDLIREMQEAIGPKDQWRIQDLISTVENSIICNYKGILVKRDHLKSLVTKD